MKVKTYGVPGLTEWHGKIKAGSLEVSVSFTGGTASPSGAQPAYFMTKDPIVQFVIENSKEFKNGFIILVMSQEVAGNHPRLAVPKVSSSEQPRLAAPEQCILNEAASTESQEAEHGADDVVPVADKSEAIEWLKEHYPDKGYSATSLRSKSAFEGACRACGVVFLFG